MSNNELRVLTQPVVGSPAEGLALEKFRTIVQDSHVNFLIGAGTPSPYFEPLGDIENVLTKLDVGTSEARFARASVQAYFFDKVLVPNLALLKHDHVAKKVIKSYARFASTINRVLLSRRSTLLGKQANVFTTNIDLAFQVAFDLLEIDVNDGFVGKLRPRLDLGEYGTIRVRQGARYEYRSEIPAINLFQVHGSAAWEQEGDEIYFDNRLAGVESVQTLHETIRSELIQIRGADEVDADQLLAAASGKQLDDDGEAFVSAYEQLSIVNPEKTKFATTVLNKTYYELLRRFANELEKENSLLLVHGFSFRDEHIRDMVLRAARTNPTLQVIVFCYSRSARDETQALLPEEQIKNGNVLFVAPHSPNDGEDERKISLDVLVEDYLTPLLAERPLTADHIIELKLGSNP